MSLRLIRTLLLTAASLGAAARDDLAKVDEFVRAELARQKIPGVAVAIVRKGAVVKAQGYGLANVEHDVAVTPETIFQSGSVGKQVTAATAMLLVEDGRLALTDPLTKFFRDAPPTWTRITVRHLLTHTRDAANHAPAPATDWRQNPEWPMPLTV